MQPRLGPIPYTPQPRDHNGCLGGSQGRITREPAEAASGLLLPSCTQKTPRRMAARAKQVPASLTPGRSKTVNMPAFGGSRAEPSLDKAALEEGTPQGGVAGPGAKPVHLQGPALGPQAHPEPGPLLLTELPLCRGQGAVLLVPEQRATLLEVGSVTCGELSSVTSPSQ